MAKNQDYEKINKRLIRLEKKQVITDSRFEKIEFFLRGVSPEMLSTLKSHSIAIELLKKELNAYNKLQNKLILEFGRVKNNLLPLADLKQIKNLNKTIKEKLAELNQSRKISEANCKQVNRIFESFNSQYLEFKKFKATEQRLKSEFDTFLDSFEDLEEQIKNTPSIKEFEKLQNQLNIANKKLKDMEQKLKKCATLDHVKKIKKTHKKKPLHISLFGK